MRIAQKSCERTANELRAKFDIPENELVHVEVSYDGPYQRRGGSKGGAIPDIDLHPLLVLKVVRC